MGRPVVHFEIVGQDPAGLRAFYGELFEWAFETSEVATDAVSAPGQYGFVDAAESGSGINGGVGGGEGYEGLVLFYVGVPEVEAALARAEELGGQRVLGPAGTPGQLVVGRFVDPEGHLVGVAGPA